MIFFHQEWQVETDYQYQKGSQSVNPHNACKMANVNAVFAVTGIYIFFFVCRGFVVW